MNRTGDPISRRSFLRTCAAVSGAAAGARRAVGAPEAASAPDDAEILARIEAHRPGRGARLPPDLNARVGAAHVDGKYYLTGQPFLIEGAQRLLDLRARLGKFWFEPAHPARSYPFHTTWGRYAGFVELARSEAFRALFDLPFSTFLLEAHSPVEDGWQRAGLGDDFYRAVTREFHGFTAHLYRTYRDRAVSFVLQHWEGDWLLRGSAGGSWKTPPDDWRERCERMKRWLAARQEGVIRGREESGAGARCVVAHAAEVNRVADAWEGIPTMTRHVLPGLTLDLVSYSAYDGLATPLRLWKCLEEIRRHARTGPLFGPGALYVGEVGIPENDQPERIAERLDEWMGVFLAADVRYVAYWQLYCNEFARRGEAHPAAPVTDAGAVRGFWLVKPDGTLSAAGRYFRDLWARGR